MDWGKYTNIVTYRVKADARARFLELLEGHYPALRACGLATETPPLIFELTGTGADPHDEGGVTFVEIFGWSRADGPMLAHEMPEVMAIWEPMGGLVEARDGRPGLEHPGATQIHFGVPR